MAPSKVPMVRLALSLHTFSDCQRLAHLARSARTAYDAREAVVAAAAGELTSIL
jgi:phosphotransferase system enzyme I (PtsI)